MTRALLALAVVLVLPASAQAAPWSAPRDVSGPHTFIDGLWTGGGLIGWRSEDGEAGAPAGRVGDPVFFDGGAAVALLKAHGDLRVAKRSGGRFGSGKRVAKRSTISRPVLAGNPRGDLALAWFENRGTANDRVEVAIQRKGHAFGAPIRLATGRIRSVSAAVGSKGDVLVAWDARGKIRTRFMRHGHGFGKAETLRSRPAFFATLHTAVTSSGRAYVAWAAQFLSEGGDRGAGFYQVAVKPAGAKFRSARLLDQVSAGVNVGSLDLALTGHDNALVAWSAALVRAAATDASGHFGAARQLSAVAPEQDLTPPGAVDVAATAGHSLVTWTVPGPLIQASFDLGAAEDVAPGSVSRAAFPGPTLAWQVKQADGVHVQEATREG
jgi:hypothetical protein